MTPLEDDVRAMLHRRSQDVATPPPPWEHLAGSAPVVELDDRRRRLGVRVAVAAAAVAFVVLALQATRPPQRAPAPPPPVEGPAADPPFDPGTAAAVWPVGRDGTATSWFRAAFEEASRLDPPPSDDARAVATAYLRHHLAPTAVTVEGRAEPGYGSAVLRWRIDVDGRPSTGRVYLRRVVLPQSFGGARRAWVVVGSDADALRVTSARLGGDRLALGLAASSAPFSTTVLLTVTDADGRRLPAADRHLVEVDEPRLVDIPVPTAGPLTVVARLVGGAPLSLTQFRLDRPVPGAGGVVANAGGVVWTGEATGPVEAASRFLTTHLGAGAAGLAVETPAAAGHDVRYRSEAIGSGTVRIRPSRQTGAWDVLAVVGDGLDVEAFAKVGDVRHFTLASAFPGRLRAVLRDPTGRELGGADGRLPGADMWTGLPITQRAEVPLLTTPVAEVRVLDGRGRTLAVAVFCLPV